MQVPDATAAAPTGRDDGDDDGTDDNSGDNGTDDNSGDDGTDDNSGDDGTDDYGDNDNDNGNDVTDGGGAMTSRLTCLNRFYAVLFDAQNVQNREPGSWTISQNRNRQFRFWSDMGPSELTRGYPEMEQGIPTEARVPQKSHYQYWLGELPALVPINPRFCHHCEVALMLYKCLPYRLPPTPALMSPDEASFPDNSRAGLPTEGTSTLTSTTGRMQAARTQPGQPDDCQEVLSHAKHQFCLNLLTVNAMWPDLIAKVHADDQLAGEVWPEITSNLIQKVVHHGSNLQNKFKSMAQQLVQGNSYNIFLPHYPSPKDTRKYTANKVAALLNHATGTWMHNSVVEKGVKNYFEHPAIKEAIVCTIFTTLWSIGSQYLDKFGSLCMPTLTLACCTLCCTLEEWNTGTYSAVTFEVAVYQSLYHSIADLNIQQLLKKLQVVASQRGGPATCTVQLFVEDFEAGGLAEDNTFTFPTDELAQNMGWQL
ncbi:hypothetical protein EDB85DRAFT_2280842 [Lactarius pseudohatsudake]|nr:hypothetical protein EDB85DRAFT_2280842 [Lactarius pseudohatsudake]